jgi:Ca-activated chloride channel family protein
MKEALKYLSKTEASMGGTEILPPLEDICKEAPADGFRRDIILITDGEISNEDEVMDLVQRHNNTTTISTVGIGRGTNEFLIKGVARAAGGASELIAPQERIEPKVLRLFQKVLAGRIGNLKIDCGNKIDQAPAYPVAFMRQATSIFAKIKKGDSKGKCVTVKQYDRQGITLGKWNIDLETVNDETMPISKLWAREKIRDIEEGSVTHEGSRQSPRKEGRKQNEVVALSRKYGIISRSTSFVGIEKKSDTEKTDSNMELRIVPTLVTSGWHGLQYQPTILYSRRADAQYSIRCMSDVYGDEPADISAPTFMRRAGAMLRRPFQRVAKPTSDRKTRSMKDDDLLKILSLQCAGGGFNIDRVIEDSLQISHSEWQSIKDDMNVKNHPDCLRLLATAIILAFLELNFGTRRDEWEGVVAKSRNWLDKQITKVSPTIKGKPLADWAKKFVMDRLKMLQDA